MALLEVAKDINKDQLSDYRSVSDEVKDWDLHKITDSGSWVGETIEKD